MEAGNIRTSGASIGGLETPVGTDNKEYAQQYGNVDCYQVELNNPYIMNVAELRYYDQDIFEGFRRARKYRSELEKKDMIALLLHITTVLKNSYFLINKKLR